MANRVLCFPPWTNGAPPETVAKWAIGSGDPWLANAFGVDVNPAGTFVAVAVRGFGRQSQNSWRCQRWKSEHRFCFADTGTFDQTISSFKPLASSLTKMNSRMWPGITWGIYTLWILPPASGALILLLEPIPGHDRQCRRPALSF